MNTRLKLPLRWMLSVCRWLVAIGVCGSVAWGLTHFKVSEINEAIEQGKSYPEHSEAVQIEQARSIDYTPYVEVIGQAVSPEYVVLRNELSGRIVAVNYLSGSEVSKDAVIIQLDVSEEQARINSAKARAKLAHVTLQRMSNLLKSKAASKSAVDTAEADLRIAEAESATWESVIQKKTIRAPFAGTLGIHQFEVGQHIEAGTEIAALVGESQEMWIDFRLPQAQGELQLGSAVYVSPIHYRNSNADSGPPVLAQVIAKDTSIARATRSLQYRARVYTTELPIRQNAVLKVQVPVAESKSMIAVNPSAIQHGRFGQFVYVLEPDKEADGFRAHRRPVKVLGKQNGLVVLSEGLNLGETIAATGAFKLNEGLLVHAKERFSTTSPVLTK